MIQLNGKELQSLQNLYNNVEKGREVIVTKCEPNLEEKTHIDLHSWAIQHFILDVYLLCTLRSVWENLRIAKVQDAK